MDKKKKFGNNLSGELEQGIQKIEPPVLESTPIKAWKNERGDAMLAIESNNLGGNILKQITGTKDSDIAESIIRGSYLAIQPIFEEGESSTKSLISSLNIIAQSLHDFQPKDAIEARLVSQATALYHHGMDRLAKAGRSELIHHSELQINMAIKLLRVHNETIETLNRYRRGGEQKVTVTHAVLANNAVVNNFTGGGGICKNKGDNPCSESAEQKPGQMAIDLAVSQQWPMEGAGYMADYVREQKRRQDS